MNKVDIDKVKFLIKNGFVHIMGSNFFNKIMMFLSSVFATRILTKSEYGMFGYVDNLISFFLIFSGLGVCSGVLQFYSEKGSQEKKEAYVVYGERFGFIESCVLTIIIVTMSMIVTYSIEGSNEYVMFYSLYPVVYFFHFYYLYLLRAKRMNKEYARVWNTYSIAYACFNVIGAYFFKTYGLILGVYCSAFVSIFLSKIYFSRATEKKYTARGLKDILSKQDKKEFIKYSVVTCLNSMLSNLLILLDIALIGYMISNTEVVATYKIASTIPLSLMFIPQSIIIFVYPYFAENNKDKSWIRDNTKKLMIASVLLNAFITITLIVGAPLMFKIIWGEKYMSSVGLFRILMINYFFSSTFRMNSNNILAALKKVQINFYVNLLTGMCNVILDFVLIYKFGVYGAAYATVSVVLISTMLLLPVLYKSIAEIPEDN